MTRLTGELNRLKQAAGEKNVERLEKQLDESRRGREGLERDFENAKKEVAEARESLEEARRDAARTQQSLQEARNSAAAAQQSFQQSQKTAGEAQQSLADEVASLREQLALARKKLDSSAGVAAELKETKESAQATRAQELEERARLTTQLEQARIEAARLKKEQEQALQKSRNEVDALQKRFTDEMAALRSELTETKEKGAASTAEAGSQLKATAKEHEQLQQQLQKANEALRTIRAEHSEERAQLMAQLQTSRTETGKVRKELEDKLERTQRDLEALKRKPAEPAPAESPDSKRGGKAAAAGNGLAHQLQEVMQQRNFLQQQVHQANDAIRSIRSEQSKEHAELTAQLEQARSQIRHLEQRLADESGPVDSQVIEQLRKQYDGRIQVMIQQKTQLTAELQKASKMLESERSRFAAAASAPGDKQPKIDQSRIDQEVARVEGLVKGITAMIDDPATELSTVIRKNVERAEWDAYLKGILFSLGKAQQR
jgi:chromosome segregation ATPase